MGNNFRENLREELDFQDIKIKELSSKTGIPVPTLDCYLGARATVPSVDAAIKIAQALSVPVEYLVTGEETNTEKPPKKPSREARELIRIIENMNSEQCSAILKLILTFAKQERPV
ncbi:MAG: helix-turn-helix domain-containing protein [Treponema sp.]|jgi:transcriptional regulator with XRE-family HTH domain|nr:helix-turn-helix domain-containing protein [Treponema sp.]